MSAASEWLSLRIRTRHAEREFLAVFGRAPTDQDRVVRSTYLHYTRQNWYYYYDGQNGVLDYAPKYDGPSSSDGYCIRMRIQAEIAAHRIETGE